jgi:hypothetical protein
MEMFASKNASKTPSYIVIHSLIHVKLENFKTFWSIKQSQIKNHANFKVLGLIELQMLGLYLIFLYFKL